MIMCIYHRPREDFVRKLVISSGALYGFLCADTRTTDTLITHPISTGLCNLIDAVMYGYGSGIIYDTVPIGGVVLIPIFVYNIGTTINLLLRNIYI